MAGEKYLETQGITVWIGTQAADPLTDTYTQIKRIKSIGEFGGEAQVSDEATCLEDTAKEKVKKMIDPGQLQLSGNHIPTDPGQLLLKAAAAMETNSPHNFKIVNNNMPSGGSHGDIFYSKAFVLSHKRTGLEVDGTQGFQSTIELTGAATEVEAA